MFCHSVKLTRLSVTPLVTGIITETDKFLAAVGIHTDSFFIWPVFAIDVILELRSGDKKVFMVGRPLDGKAGQLLISLDLCAVRQRKNLSKILRRLHNLQECLRPGIQAEQRYSRR